MEIKPVKYEYNRKRRLKPEYGKTHPDSIAQYYAGVYNEKSNNRGYNVSFSGSQGSVDAAKTLMGRIMKSRAFNWLTVFGDKHQVATTALVALFLAGGLRPLFTIALPGKNDMEDKLYAAGQALSSGVIGFIFSLLVTTPIDQGAKYIYDESRKISRADYNELSVPELAKYIKKNNVTLDDITKKNNIKREDLSNVIREKLKKMGHDDNIITDILSDTPEKTSAILNNNEKLKEDYYKALAECTKEKNIDIMPVRTISDKIFKIVSSKTDRINKLKHQMATEKDTVKLGEILSELRNLENWLDKIDSSKKNISDWIIAIPRAWLTIALIPVILKYVFHIEKKNKAQNNTNISTEFAKTQIKSINEFMGGGK